MGKILLAFCLILCGCSVKNKQISKNKSAVITLINQNFKINSTGFIINDGKKTNLQIYENGINVLELKVGKRICLNFGCKEQLSFNRDFFKNQHYKGFLNEMLNSKPIYDKKNLIKTDCGFNQNIKKLFIEYSVCQKTMKFIDKKNRIKIIIKELD